MGSVGRGGQGRRKEWTPTEQSLALNSWWRTQSRFRSKRQAAKELGIPQSSFVEYFYGRKPSRKHSHSLHEATGLDVFDVAMPPGSKVGEPKGPAGPVDMAEAKLSEVSDTLRVLAEQFNNLHGVFETMKEGSKKGRIVPFPKREGPERRAALTVELLYELVVALDTFRSSPHDRAVLREKVHGPDVGYLISLLNALMDEDRFQTWNAVSSYRPLGVQR